MSFTSGGGGGGATPGPAGPPGPQGAPGASTSVFHYQIDASNQSANDPGPGKIKYNNVLQTAATELYFDWLTNDDFDVTALFKMMNPPSQFVIQDRDLAINHQVWALRSPVVMMPDWFIVPVTFIRPSGTGSFISNQIASVLLLAQGTPGPAGPPGPTGPQGLPGVGFPDAPIDGKAYVRKSGAWAVELGFADVPMDNKTYARKNAAWVSGALEDPVILSRLEALERDVAILKCKL